MGHHVRTKCGQVVQVRIVDAVTGKPVGKAAGALKLEVNLMGPYRESEEGMSGRDATFSCDEWTPEQYDKVSSPQAAFSCFLDLHGRLRASSDANVVWDQWMSTWTLEETLCEDSHVPRPRIFTQST